MFSSPGFLGIPKTSDVGEGCEAAGRSTSEGNGHGSLSSLLASTRPVLSHGLTLPIHPHHMLRHAPSPACSAISCSSSLRPLHTHVFVRSDLPRLSPLEVAAYTDRSGHSAAAESFSCRALIWCGPFQRLALAGGRAHPSSGLPLLEGARFMGGAARAAENVDRGRRSEGP